MFTLNLEVYETVQRWLNKLQAKSRSLNFDKSSTKRAGLFWLKRYCKFLEANPDSLIRERMEQIQSTNMTVKRKHEELVESFIIELRNKKFAPNSTATAIGLVRSFYKSNFAPLVEVTSIRPFGVRPFKVPTIKDIKKMCSVADMATKAWVLAQMNSGLGNTDLLSLSVNTLSSEFGTIKTQLRKGIVPIHIEIRRQKTGERTDSFFGPNAIEALNEYLPNGVHGRIFRMSARSVEVRVKALGIKAKVATKEVPIVAYSLRKAFNTYMKLAGINEALVERMMGHSIGRVREAYLVTGRSEGIFGIPISKLAEIYMQAYPTIDITQV